MFFLVYLIIATLASCPPWQGYEPPVSTRHWVVVRQGCHLRWTLLLKGAAGSNRALYESTANHRWEPDVIFRRVAVRISQTLHPWREGPIVVETAMEKPEQGGTLVQSEHSILNTGLYICSDCLESVIESAASSKDHCGMQVTTLSTSCA